MFFLKTFFILAHLVTFLSCQGIFFPGQEEDQVKLDADVSGECLTEDGRACIFPFNYDNITYFGCTLKNDPENKAWCSTKVEEETQEHISGGGHWGHCNSQCKLDPTTTDDVVRKGGADEDDEKCTTASGEKGTCRPASTCPFSISTEAIEDSICSIKNHVCCKELLANDPQIVEKLALAAASKNDTVEKPDEISVQQVEESLFSLRFGLPEAVEAQEEEDEFTPSSLHLAFNKPRAGVLGVDQSAGTFERTTQDIQENFGNGIGLRFFNADNVAKINEECPWTPTPSCDQVSKSKFRSIDGSCNNLKEPNYGRASTPFQRILDPDYSLGSLSSPRISRAGFDLPSARKVSTTIAKTTANEERKDDVRTVFVMQLGQFIDHDITHAPNHASQCCNKDGSFPASFDSNKCYPIAVPSDDPFWQGKLRCMNFARSLASPNLKCELESRQQMNQITHWLDASNIYGSEEFETNALRQRVAGLLKISGQPGTLKGGLPSCSKEATRSTIAMCQGCSSCFFAGDGRANEQHNLLAMHTLWMREHNRIAKFLHSQNPSWEDEKVFQEARRLVIAEYQHIIYNEWLPLIVGSELMTSFGLWPLTQGHSDQYLDTFDPRITNEFAAAAFRFGHSLIPSTFSMVSQPQNGARSLISQNMHLKDIFFKPDQFKSNAMMMDDLLRGLAVQDGDAWDNVFSDDITNHLFETKKNSGGLDLVALNIQRGRDHGLPGYNAYREVCSIGKARDFDDLLDYISADDVSRLKNIYSSVDDIDLYVGGFLERKHRDSILGPVFKCLIADTFARLKIGDRFFYDLGLDERTRFTEKQLREIRKVSMARIVCDNSERINGIQPQVFKKAESQSLNAPVSCKDFQNIPAVNLALFAAGL